MSSVADIARATVGRLDSGSGAGIERGVRAHPRRRLAHAGHSAQVDPPRDGGLWAAEDPPPQDGCSIDVLVDGAEALPASAEALGGARSHVHIAGWHIAPGFRLLRDGRAPRLRDLLAELALQ